MGRTVGLVSGWAWMAALTGCVLGEKGVGIESDSDASSSSGGTAMGTASDASMSSTSAGSASATGSDDTTSGGTDDSAEGTDSATTTGGCPNPDVCDGPEQGFEQNIVAAGGCGNVEVWAADGVLHVLGVHTDDMSDVIGQAAAAGAPIELELDLATAEVFATIAVGEDADVMQCTDYLAPETDPFVIYWLATSGTVTMVVDPPDENGITTVDVTLTDAVFSPPKGGDEVTVPSFVWTDVQVGWLPG